MIYHKFIILNFILGVQYRTHRLRFQNDRQYREENQIYQHTMLTIIVMEVYYEHEKNK